jgi:hypothetical protein
MGLMTGEFRSCPSETGSRRRVVGANDETVATPRPTMMVIDFQGMIDFAKLVVG